MHIDDLWQPLELAEADDAAFSRDTRTDRGTFGLAYEEGFYLKY